MDDVYSNKFGLIPHPLAYAQSNGFVGWMDMNDPEQLLSYYHFGLFPWENYGTKGAFFFPSQRYMIIPSEIKIPKSIRSYFNNQKFQLSFDQAFEEVMMSCRHVKRKGGAGTWISDEFIKVYKKLHDKGYAHSVEVWQDDQLVGGLYGVSIGKVFTGESMFSIASNASRFALISLAIYLEKAGIRYIDCQIRNPYLETFGGFDMPASDFFILMKQNYLETSLVGDWGELFSQFEI